MISILISTGTHAAICSCDCDLMNAQVNALTTDYSFLTTAYEKSINQSDSLNETLKEIMKEREYYKLAYENSNISKITVGDFLSLNDTMNNFYFDVDNKMTYFNYSLTQVQNRVTKYALNCTIALVSIDIVSMFALGLYLKNHE